jgi:hypothetical protein
VGALLHLLRRRKDSGSRYPACLVRVHHLLVLVQERYFLGLEDDRADIPFPDDEFIRIEDEPFPAA